MRKNFVGIDVSKAKLDFAIGSEITSTFKNSEEGIQEAIKWLKKNTSHPLKIVIESTSWYHWVACLMLKEEGFDVRSINPIITKKYQRSSIRDSKTDRVDAIRLAEIAKLEPNLPKFFDSRETLKNKRFHALLKKLEKVKQELQRSLIDATKSFEALGVTIDLKAIEEALKSIKTAIRVCKKIIENSANEFAHKLAQVRGVSLFQATMIATSISGREFQSREKLVAFYGLDVRVRQSGTWTGRSHLSKRGNPYYRKILFHIGWSLKQNNKRFAEYYQRLIKEGKHYYTAIIATARKFLYYVFKLSLDFAL